MNNKLEFKDLGFKLAVIDELMYNQEVLTPRIDCRKFIADKRNLTISEAYVVIENEGYEILPEVLEYFKNLEITAINHTVISIKFCEICGRKFNHKHNSTIILNLFQNPSNFIIQSP